MTAGDGRASVAAAAGDVLDAGGLADRVEAVLSGELYWFPVRHHSPAVARHLEVVIRERRPRLIFLEGPAPAGELIPYLVDRKTRPPVAIYTSFRDDDNVLGLAGIASPSPDVPARFASWYPLLPYSPELAALRAAARVGARVVFFDLPHWALIQPLRPDEEEADEAAGAEVAGAEVAGAEVAGDSHGESPAAEHAPGADRGESLGRDLATDRLIEASDFYRRLAEVAGSKCWDEAWDSLFESHLWHGGKAARAEAFRRELATFCAAARATSSPEAAIADGTVARERFMLRTVSETLAETGAGEGEAMVVCGGFHLFLDRDDPEPPPPLPAGTVYSAVVPYSYPRCAEGSGYGAGNRAPRFYQTAWEHARGGRTAEDLAVDHVLRVIRLARRRGEALSTADALAATQHARLLARLRGRRLPVLDDLRDGLVTCCAKGPLAEDGWRLQQAMAEIEVGVRVGRVTEDAGRLPIVADFYRCLEELGLEEHLQHDRFTRLKLDKREASDARRSAFCHRLRFLEVPGAEPVGGLGGIGVTLFQEHWQLRWRPRIDAALVEQSLYGNTVEAACLARLEEALARHHDRAGRVARHLVEACDMDLAGLVPRLANACRQALDLDDRFVSLARANRRLLVLERQQALSGLDPALLGELVERAFSRACFALPNVASVPPEEEEGIVDGVRTLAEILLDPRRAPEAVDRRLFIDQLELAAADSAVPFLRGAFLGILVELKVCEVTTLAAEISGLARSAPEEMVRAGDFLSGVLAASKASILLGAGELIAAIDELLRAADWDSFTIMLPRLRAAFDRLSPPQLTSFSQRVAERYGLREVEALDLDTSVAAAAEIARIDHQVAEIMEQWEL